MKYSLLLLLGLMNSLGSFSGIAVAAEDTTPVAAALRPYVERHALAGAVTAVATGDKVIAIDAVGFSDVSAQKPLKADAVFWIASMSKPVTAAAVMMLVDEGKISLDDPVEKHLPEFHELWLKIEADEDHQLLKRPAHAITVREILSHTSGMPFESALETQTLDSLPLAVAVRSHAMTPLLFEPGTKYQYSNAGINTAGRIIEVVSGQAYEDFLQKRLFEPLGMKDATFWPNDEQLARLAKSYIAAPSNLDVKETKIGQLRYPLNDRENRYPMPAGGLFSTADDMVRFGQMLLNGGTFEGRRILSEESVRQMTSRQTAVGIPDSYGLGLGVGGETFGHGGAFATNLTVDKKRGLVLVYMVQHASFPRDGGEALGAFHRAAADLGKP